MRKLLLLCVALAALLLVAFVPPAFAQGEEGQDDGVIFEGDVRIDCPVFFDRLERFRNDPPSDRRSQRDFEEAQGFVRLCTERGVVPPFDRTTAGDSQDAPATPSSGSSDGSGKQTQQVSPPPRSQAGTAQAQSSGGGKAGQLPATGGVPLLTALLSAGALVIVGGLLVRKVS